MAMQTETPGRRSACTDIQKSKNILSILHGADWSLSWPSFNARESDLALSATVATATARKPTSSISRAWEVNVLSQQRLRVRDLNART